MENNRSTKEGTADHPLNFENKEEPLPDGDDQDYQVVEEVLQTTGDV